MYAQKQSLKNVYNTHLILTIIYDNRFYAIAILTYY
jgi:hypothetical protein